VKAGPLPRGTGLNRNAPSNIAAAAIVPFIAAVPEQGQTPVTLTPANFSKNTQSRRDQRPRYQTVPCALARYRAVSSGRQRR
jgi:hypothetical protein